jgi:hypothetical protein
MKNNESASEVRSMGTSRRSIRTKQEQNVKQSTSTFEEMNLEDPIDHARTGAAVAGTASPLRSRWPMVRMSAAATRQSAPEMKNAGR